MKYYIGIDLGGTNVRTLLVDENGESYSEVKGPTECQNGPDYVCDKIIKQIESLDTSVCGGLQGVEGIGIGAPGPVDTELGIMIMATYETFAAVYDAVMDDSLYDLWTDFSLRHLPKTMDKKKLPLQIQKPTQSVIRLPQTPAIASLFQSMRPYFDSSTPPTERVINTKLQEGVYALLEINEQFYPNLFDFNTPWKIDLLEFMEKNYAYDLTIEDITQAGVLPLSNAISES